MSTTSVPTGSIHAFGDVVVDTRAHRVTKAGHEVPLEPKAYGVLLELLREPGAVVSRDALLDAVWGHRHVTPAVLNRVIALLRKALGDDADHPHVIRTVHGTGYSFVAPVRSASEPEADAAALVASLAAPATARVAAPESRAPPSKAPEAWKIGAALAVTVALVLLPMLRDRDEPAPAAPAEPATPAQTKPAATTLAVLGPDVDEDDPDDRALAFAYVDGLRDALARMPSLEVMPQETARLNVLQGVAPAEAGARLDVGHVVKARFDDAPDGKVALAVALVRVSDVRTVWEQRWVQSREQVFRTLGAVLDAVNAVTSTVVRTPDPFVDATPDALDLLARGYIELQLGGDGAPRRAIARFEQALVIDPRLVPAYVGLAHAWREMGARRELGLDEAAAKGHLAVAKALEINPKYVPAYLAEALLLTLQWRGSEAAVPLRRARALAPDDPSVLALSANLEGYAGRPLAALALRERVNGAWRLSPVHYALWARDLATAGRLDEALAKQQEFLAVAGISPSKSGWSPLRGEFGFYAEALEAAAGTQREGTLYPRANRFAYELALGDAGAAAREFEGFEPLHAEPPLYADSMLMLRWMRGDADGALRWIEGAGAPTVQQPWRDAFHAQALALAGRRDDALATYRTVFADPGNRDLVAQSFFVLTIGLAQLANWATLEREAADGRGEALAELDARLAALTEGGYAKPVIDYVRASAALLHGDVAAADAALGRAIARGWRYRPAHATDLVWRGLESEAWYRAHLDAIDAALAAERAKRSTAGVAR